MVLDDAGSPDVVRALLPGSPTCLVLVTSRDRLTGLVARDGAHQISVDPLDPDAAVALLTRIIGADWSPDGAAATAELARLCGYLPLALRIAAAKLVERPADAASYLADLAADQLTALQVGGDRQAAVQAAFDLSYAPLPAEARRLLRLLGLAPAVDTRWATVRSSVSSWRSASRSASSRSPAVRRS